MKKSIQSDRTMDDVERMLNEDHQEFVKPPRPQGSPLERLRRQVEELGLIPAKDVPSESKQPGESFFVRKDRRQFYPAFQFGPDMKPLPVMRKILACLGYNGKNGWDIAIWFICNNTDLDNDATPVEALKEHPTDVLRAAKYEFKGFDF